MPRGRFYGTPQPAPRMKIVVRRSRKAPGKAKPINKNLGSDTKVLGRPTGPRRADPAGQGRLVTARETEDST